MTLQTTVLAAMIEELDQNLDLEAFGVYFKHIANDDRRTVLEDLKERFGDKSLAEKTNEIEAKAIALVAALRRFRHVLYVLDREEATGNKGNWREIAKEQSQYRVSVHAIKALREANPDLSVGEARAVLEAFNDGMIE